MSSVDIGLCVSRVNGTLTLIRCLDDDGRNFCCSAPRTADFVRDGRVECCTRDQYADQIWVTVAVVKGFSILLAMIFIYFSFAAAWFYWKSFDIKEAEVRKSKREIIRHLLKQQVLQKVELPEASFISHIKNLSRSVSDSMKRRERKKSSIAVHRPKHDTRN